MIGVVLLFQLPILWVFILLVLMCSLTSSALLFRPSVICSCTELFANNAKLFVKSKSVSWSVFVLFMMACCVSIDYCITKSRRIKKRMLIEYNLVAHLIELWKNLTPISVLIQQLESAHNDLNIFMYFSGTPYMDNMFHSDGLLTLSSAFLKSV